MPTIPETMRAAAIERLGEPEVLTPIQLPVPKPEVGEVLIAVNTAGVASWHAEMRAGWWPEGKPRFPLVLGTDGSGTIAAVGPRVRRFAIGDQVYATASPIPRAASMLNMSPCPSRMPCRSRGCSISYTPAPFLPLG